jgi:hypothetical protein
VSTATAAPTPTVLDLVNARGGDHDGLVGLAAKHIPSGGSFTIGDVSRGATGALYLFDGSRSDPFPTAVLAR